MRTKHCPDCEITKPISEFYGATGGTSDGYRHICKRCDNERRSLRWRRSVGKMTYERTRPTPREPQPIPCPKGCHGMTWRVVGSKCKHCGLPRAPEVVKRPELWRGGNLTRAIDEMGFSFETGRKAS